MNLDKLKVFYHCALASSFKNCGLNLSPSVISRHISDIEYSLKIQLFVRSTKNITLTPAGEKLLGICKTVFKELEDVKYKIAGNEAEPEGIINITTPSGWISTILLHLIKPFMDQYPKIRLNIKNMDHIPSFEKNEIDIALLPLVPENPHLNHVKLSSINLRLCASQTYLEQFGIPKTISDLDNHRLIACANYEHPAFNVNWHLYVGMPDAEKRTPYLTVSNLFDATEIGYGIATLAQENILFKKSKLVPVLPDIKGPSISAYALYPKRLETSKRVQLFISYLQQSLTNVDHLLNL